MFRVYTGVVGFFCLGLSFAGTLGSTSCEVFDWTAPCEKTAYGVGIHALYVQTDTTSSQSTMLYQQNQTFFPLGIAPLWGWAFELNATYHYHTGNDMSLSWSHLRSGTNKNNLERELSVFLPSDGGQAPQLWKISDTRTSIYPAWDQVNVEWAQRMTVDEIKSIRMHGGINYSRVSNFGSGYFSGVNESLGQSKKVSLNRDMSYSGFGPRVGLDLNFDWDNGLNIYAKSALSILAGISKSSYFYENLLLAQNSYVYSVSDAKIVGEFDAKLGLQYHFALAEGDLSIDAGWLWAHYTNPLLGTDYQNMAKPISYGFGLQGVYFGIQWLGVLI